MNLLSSAIYDPTGGAAVTKATTALLAMTALDTVNLRLAITVPAHGKVRFRLRCVIHGAATCPQILLGVMNGATVIGRVAPLIACSNPAATTRYVADAEFVATGLAPGAMNVDAAYGVETIVAATAIKYGGLQSAAADDAHGAFVFEAWDPQPLKLALDGGVNVTQYGGAAGTFAAGRPEVNTSHWGGTAVATAVVLNAANIGADAITAAKIANGAIDAATFAAGAIDAAAIAADAIGASELAADAATEIGTAVWASASRLLTAGTNIVLAKGTGLTGLNDLDAAGVRGAVGLASANLDTQLGLIAGYIDTEVASILAAVDTEVAAIKLKTDNLPASPAATGDAMALTGAAVDAILDDAVDGVTTARQILRGIASALLAKASGLGTATAVFRDLADTKDRITATVDADGNRTAVVRDLT